MMAQVIAFPSSRIVRSPEEREQSPRVLQLVAALEQRPDLLQRLEQRRQELRAASGNETATGSGEWRRHSMRLAVLIVDRALSRGKNLEQLAARAIERPPSEQVEDQMIDFTVQQVDREVRRRIRKANAATSNIRGNPA